MLTTIRGAEMDDSASAGSRRHPEVCYDQRCWGPNDGLQKTPNWESDEVILRPVGRRYRGLLRSKSRVFKGIDSISKQMEEQSFKDRSIQ